MKQSLINAMNEAKELSLKNEGVAYYVFNSDKSKPVVHSQYLINSSLLNIELFRKGYAPTVKYINGVESRA